MRPGLLAGLLAFPCALACSANDDGAPMVSHGGSAGQGGNGGAAGAAGSAGAGGTGGAAPITVEGVAPFRGDARGAYTIMHDDLCDYNIDSLFDIAEPELNERGLRAGFGAIVQRCEERAIWDRVNQMITNGHEIMNHSWTHQDIGLGADMALEIDQATTVLNANLVGQTARFFIFPYDSFNDEAVSRLGTLGYLGARAGSKGLNDSDFPDGLRVQFDVYGGENSIYFAQGDILKYYVDLAVSDGGWAVREFHGIADATFNPVPVGEYTAHLDYVKSKVDSGELWVDTPSTIIHYRYARMNCGSPSVTGNTLSFASSGGLCGEHASTLTVLLTTSEDVATLTATQGSQALKTKKLGPKRYAVDMDPKAGSALISLD